MSEDPTPGTHDGKPPMTTRDHKPPPVSKHPIPTSYFGGGCNLVSGCPTPQTCDAQGACRVPLYINPPPASKSPIPEVCRAAPNWVLPTDSAERKRVPLWSGLFRYFPDALVAVARLSWKGNEKHNAGQPLHWSRDKSNDHADCLLRHQMDCGTGEVDPDSGELHEVEVAWRALAQLQLALERQRQGGKR